MSDFSIDLPIPEIKKRLSDIQRKQIPFATALALTVTAADAQKDIRKVMAQRFVIRSKWIQSGVRTTKATKKKMFSTVFSRDSFMRDQEYGGVRKTANTFAIPRKIRRSKASRITKAKRPAAMLNKPNVFIGKTRTGKPAIFKRVGKKGRLDILYFLQPKTVTIKAKLGMRETVARTVKKRWRKNWGKAFARALKTAR